MPRWESAGAFAWELDRRLEELAASVRNAPLPLTEDELRQATWHATGLERAREIIREVLNGVEDQQAARRGG